MPGRRLATLLALLALTEMPGRVQADSPSGRIDYAFAYLPALDALVMHGGMGDPEWVPLAEVWKLDAGGWSQITTPDSPAFFNHSMACDARRRVLVLCGQKTGPVQPLETWEFDGAQWAQVTSPAFSERGIPKLAYDARRQRVVLYWALTTLTGAATWEYDGVQWTQMEPASHPPSLPYGPVMTYDAALGRTVLVGSMTAADVQTWLWDGSDWATATGPRPNDPRGGAMTYDAARAQTVLLAVDQTTWTFDGTGWTQLDPAHSPAPAPLMFMTLAYDPTRRVCAFFGGEHYIFGSPTTHPTTTWEWDGQDWREFAGGSAPVALDIRAVPPDKVAISWPASAVGYVLAGAPSPAASADWQIEPALPEVVGDQFVVTAAASDAARFYRLQ